MNTLGGRIRKIRKELPGGKVTQKEFGEKLGVSAAVITSYELDKVVPPPATQKLICSVYKISPAWLETGEGSMTALSYNPDLAQEIRSIMECADDFTIDVMSSLASMPSEWWAEWRMVLERERGKGKK